MISNLTIDMLCMNRVRLRIWVISTMYISTTYLTSTFNWKRYDSFQKKHIAYCKDTISYKKKKMTLKDILRSQLLCESPSKRIRRPSVLCEQSSFFLVPSILQLHWKMKNWWPPNVSILYDSQLFFFKISKHVSTCGLTEVEEYIILVEKFMNGADYIINQTITLI